MAAAERLRRAAWVQPWAAGELLTAASGHRCLTRPLQGLRAGAPLRSAGSGSKDQTVSPSPVDTSRSRHACSQQRAWWQPANGATYFSSRLNFDKGAWSCRRVSLTGRRAAAHIGGEAAGVWQRMAAPAGGRQWGGAGARAGRRRGARLHGPHRRRPRRREEHPAAAGGAVLCAPSSLHLRPCADYYADRPDADGRAHSMRSAAD